MKIYIDGIGISLLQGTGLFTYTAELLNNLFESYPQPVYGITCNREVDPGILHRDKNINWFTLEEGKSMDSFVESLILRDGVDIFHSPNNGFSLPGGEKREHKCKYLMTVHDVIAAQSSSLVDGKYMKRFQGVFPGSLEKADRIVAVSEFIKSEIIRYYCVPEKKIEVIYPGIGELFKPLDFDESKEFMRSTYNIEGDIILYAGSIHVRKNVKALLHIFKDISKLSKEAKLVIAGKIDGKRHEHYLELKELVKFLKLEDKVCFTGTVSYRDMPYLYNAAKCVVNLSDYEGFPLTVLESLCCGTPVVCGNMASFREVVNRSAILVDTHNEKDIREAIIGVSSDKSYKKEVVENSSKIRQKYNWNNSVKKYVRLYESMISV